MNPTEYVTAILTEFENVLKIIESIVKDQKIIKSDILASIQSAKNMINASKLATSVTYVKLREIFKNKDAIRFQENIQEHLDLRDLNIFLKLIDIDIDVKQIHINPLLECEIIGILLKIFDLKNTIKL
jgi:hypothetical protein